VRIASLLSKVHLRKQDDADLTNLLNMSRDRFHSMQYSWQAEIAKTLAEGWLGNSRVKAECLNSYHHHYHHPELMDRETALIVLIKAFPQDDEVAKIIADELKDLYSFSSFQD